MLSKHSKPFAFAICLMLVAACENPSAEFVAVEPVSEEPVFLEAPAAIEPRKVTPAPVAQRRVTGSARVGVVTAGDIDDTLNLAAFQSYQAQRAITLKLPRLDLASPIRFQLVGANGAPAPGVAITLRAPGASAPFHEGQTGVDGRVAVFPRALGVGALRNVELRAFQGGREILRHTLRAGHSETVRAPVAFQPYQPEFADMVFVIDVSGSMGDELDWLTKEFASLARSMRNAAPKTDFRFGLIAYQSPGDPFVLREFGFTKNPQTMVRWLKRLDANGGRGGEEVVGRALERAIDMPWRRGRGERLVFQIGDEPPSAAGAGRMLRATRAAAGKQVQIFGLAASGVENRLEYLLRQAAVTTQGRYLFLTDDSGVGLAHAEPTIACYRVTRLRDLLTRVLHSELSGIRREAATSAVIRTVGNYDRGVCNS